MGIRSGIRKAKAVNLAKRINKPNKRPVHRKKPEPTAEVWEREKTTITNYNEIGLARDLNNQVTLLQNVKKVELPVEEEVQGDAKTIQALNRAVQPWKKTKNAKLRQVIKASEQEAVAKSKRKPKINKDEAVALENLMKLYKTDYDKMRRDFKTNIFQWTEHQCRRKLINYVDKFGMERIKKFLSQKEIDLARQELSDDE